MSRNRSVGKPTVARVNRCPETFERGEIQGLVKGLHILEALNESPGMMSQELSHATRIPRTTLNRYLKTLERHRYVFRDAATARYIPNSRVLELACGFDLVAKITIRANEEFERTGTGISWPMYVSVPVNGESGPRMRVCACTDQRSPLAVEKLQPWQTIPVLQCSAGLAWIASLPEREWAGVVDRVLQDEGASDLPVVWTPAELGQQRVRIREAGYCEFLRPGRYSNQVGLAVPVYGDRGAVAAVSVRYAQSAVSAREARDAFLPKLRAIAGALGR